MRLATKTHNKHTRTRIRERAGGDVTYKELREAVRHAQRQGIPPIERQTCSRSLYQVEIRGRTYFPVWSKRHKTVVTILTAHMVERKLRRLSQCQ